MPGQRWFRSDDTSQWKEQYENGSDGDWTPTDQTLNPIDTVFSGNEGNLVGAGTNAALAAKQAVLILQMQGTNAGRGEFNKIKSYSPGAITFKYPLVNTYNSTGNNKAQLIVMPRYKTVNIPLGVTVTIKAYDPNTGLGGVAAWFARRRSDIVGVLDGVGKGFPGGASENPIPGSYQGSGTGGVGTRNANANGNGGGGAGNSNTSAGGGGNATQGEDGTGGNGGTASGNSELTLITMGGSGGGALGIDQGTGGYGGPVVIIVSPNQTYPGSLLIDGTDGEDSTSDGGSGAGAGGSARLVGVNIDLGNGISGVGGVGGSASGPQGGDGAVGRLHVDYAKSVTGTTNPTYTSRLDKKLFPRASGAAVLLRRRR